jgi:hypothetical protein
LPLPVILPMDFWIAFRLFLIFRWTNIWIYQPLKDQFSWPFSKAFDRINRSGLWTKMIKNGMNGKCFNVIKSMYQNIKSCVTRNGVSK